MNSSIKIIKFKGTDNNLFDIARNIRYQVFYVGLNIPAEIDCDGFDKEAQHYLLLLNKLPVATARWRETENGIKLERFAVLSEYRNNNIGKELLLEMLKDVKPLRNTIYLHAQHNAVRFYEKNGFVKEGEPFYEADIEHHKMIFNNM